MPSRQTPQHNVLFSIPRTASQLLTRQLNLADQPSLLRAQNGYDGFLLLPAVAQRFWNTFFGAVMEEWSDEQWKLYRSALQTAFDTWCDLLEDADCEGKGTYVKEHVSWLVDSYCEAEALGYDLSKRLRSRFEVAWLDEHPRCVVPRPKSKFNVTCLPDAFLLNCLRPTFMIRHPVYAFPSFVRISLKDEPPATVMEGNRTFKWECTYRWTRSLYRFYMQSLSFDRRSNLSDVQYPIVVDAADLGNEGLVRKYAQAVGLDEERVAFEWKPATDEEKHKMNGVLRRMSTSILESTGVDASKLGDAVVDWEYDKERLKEEWEEEFGDVITECLVQYVEESLPDYYALWKVRLQA